MIRAVRIQSLLLLAAAALCSACVTPPPSPTELAQQNLARVVIESPDAWIVSAPKGQGMAVEFVSLDGADVCKPKSCPTELLVPAGTRSLGFRCLLLTGNLRLPKGFTGYRGDFISDHTYAVKPDSVVPECKVQVKDKAAP